MGAELLSLHRTWPCLGTRGAPVIKHLYGYDISNFYIDTQYLLLTYTVQYCIYYISGTVMQNPML